MRVPVWIGDQCMWFEESALLHLVDAAERKVTAPCKRCGVQVVLTPVQVAAGETVGPTGVLCAGCYRA